MFGRRLKKDYRWAEYNIVDSKSGEVVEARNMSLRDPIMTVVASGFVSAFVITLMFGTVVLPLAGINISDSNEILLFGAMFVAGAGIAYYYITE